MSLLSVPLEVGDLRGTIFTYERTGDVLPMHTHGPDDVHITIVARGRVVCRVKGESDSTHAAGAVIDWDPGVWHEVEALEDNSRIVNVIKKAQTNR